MLYALDRSCFGLGWVGLGWIGLQHSNQPKTARQHRTTPNRIRNMATQRPHNARTTAAPRQHHARTTPTPSTQHRTRQPHHVAPCSANIAPRSSIFAPRSPHTPHRTSTTTAPHPHHDRTTPAHKSEAIFAAATFSDCSAAVLSVRNGFLKMEAKKCFVCGKEGDLVQVTKWSSRCPTCNNSDSKAKRLLKGDEALAAAWDACM